MTKASQQVPDNQSNGVNRKLLKTFATTTHTQLLAQVRQELDLIMSSKKTWNTDFRIRVESLTVSEAAEQITYALFNQLTFLYFIESRGWLSELLPDFELENPSQTLQALEQLQKILPEVFALPILTSEFLTFAHPEFFAKIFNTMNQNFAALGPETFHQVESLGWLYQYYNSVEKTRLVKLKKPYKKSAVPIVTQIFTPKFIVQYLIDNSLGKFLKENHFLPADYDLQFSVGSFAPQQTSAKPTFADLQQIKFLDPCCGSGHILVYAFELFYRAYQNLGVEPDTISTMILQNNLHGLDVDDFAVQIARAVLIFTAREHDEQFFHHHGTEQNPNSRKLNIFAIPESNVVGTSIFSALDDGARTEALELFTHFDNAKELGSLLAPPQKSFAKLAELATTDTRTAQVFQPMLNIARMLDQSYHIVVTNPPYINTGLMNAYLKRYVGKYFAKFNRDVFACFVKRAQELTCVDGYFALMTPNVWLTTSSFVQLREFLLDETNLVTLLSLAPGTFFEEAVVNIVAFAAQNSTPDNSLVTFIQLREKGGLQTAEHEFKNARLDFFLLSSVLKKSLPPNPIAQNFYLWPQQIFRRLPDSLIAFSAPEKFLHHLEHTAPLATYAEPRQGIITGDNDQFLRYWFEVDPASLAVSPNFFVQATSKTPTWFPHNKGGDYRKWYGNQEYVINWADDGRAVKNHKSGDNKLSRIQNLDYNFRTSVSWSAVTSGDFSARFYDETFTFNVAGPSCFAPPSLQKNLLGFLNSCVAAEFAKIINPTMNFNVGDIAKIPLIVDETYRAEIDQLVTRNISIAKQDYDVSELSWNFIEHPLLAHISEQKLLSLAYDAWRKTCEQTAQELRQNEERLNEIFIDIYGLQNVLFSSVDPAKLAVQIPSAGDAATSFLSFFVGHELGRYNPNTAADEIIFTSTRNIIDRLKTFLTTACGASHLEENLCWLADSLKRPTATDAEEFLQEYFATDFWPIHRKTYHDKPIYWQIDSGPEHAVRGFFYVHNFTPATLYKKLFDHISIAQEKLLAELNQLETKKQQTIWPTERRRFEALQTKTVDKLRELNDFYQKLTALASQEIMLDLDAGITKNYAKFAPILTELKPSRYLQKKRALLAKKD